MEDRFFTTLDAPKYLKSWRLYERKPVTDLWNKLTVVARQQWKWKNVTDQANADFVGCRQRLVQVYGPPGSGKSRACFHWVKSACVACSTKAYWMSCAAEAERCWSIEGGEGAAAGNTTMVKNEPATPQTAEDMGDASIVVFDGIRAETLERWRTMMNELTRKGIAVIVVSSEGVRFHDGDSGDIIKLQHFVPSWTLEEYFRACQDDDFWRACYALLGGTLHDDATARQELIRKKFESAGHSARYMFEFFQAEIVKKISGDADAMGGIDSLERALQNTRSSGAVNSLIARLQADKNGITPQQVTEMPSVSDLQVAGVGFMDFALLETEGDSGRPQPLLVSSFASKEVTRNIPSSIERLRRVAATLSNKAIEGYAFEEQFKKSLSEAVNPGLSLAVRDQIGQIVEYTVDRFISCKASEVEATLKATNLMPNTWIFVGGQQGAFDAVNIQSKTHIRFIQTTVGQKHTFYLDAVDLLLQKLASWHTWTHVDFLLLRAETERIRSFTLQPARGRLQSFTRFDGEPWDQREPRNNVSYKFLDWTEG